MKARQENKQDFQKGFLHQTNCKLLTKSWKTQMNTTYHYA